MVPDPTMIIRSTIALLTLCASVCFAGPTRLSSDGMTVVTVLDDKIKLTNTKTGNLVHRLFALSHVSVEAITSLAVSDDRALVAFAAGGPRPELYSAANGDKLALSLPENQGTVIHVGFSERADYLIGKTDTGALLTWKTEGGALEVIVAGGPTKLNRVAPFGVLPGDLKYIFDAPDNLRSNVSPELVTITGVPGLNRAQTITEMVSAEGQEIRDIAFSEDGATVAVAEKHAVVLRFKETGGKLEVTRVEGEPTEPIEVLGVALSARGDRLAVVMPGGVQVIELQGGQSHRMPLTLPAGLRYASVRFLNHDDVVIIADGVATPHLFRIPSASNGTCAEDVAI